MHVLFDVLQAREQDRSTSPIGHTGSHYDIVHVGNTYDFEINHVDLTAEQATTKILEFVAQHSK